MEIKKITDFGTDENCYILINNENCVAIDPGQQWERVYDFIKGRNLTLLKIFLTHCHWDHASGAAMLSEKTNAIIAASEECRVNIQNPKTNVSELFGEYMDADVVGEVVSDGEKCSVGGIEIECIKTPGHTDCGVCYIVGNIIISGDTLFKGTVGRWDFPTGNFSVLENTIKEKLYKKDGFIVYPGHGDMTTIDSEKKYNACVCDI